MSSFIRYTTFTILTSVFGLLFVNCKTRQKTQKNNSTTLVTDSISDDKCRLGFKNAKTLTTLVKANEFSYNWISAKADVLVKIDGEEHSLDIKLRGKKDSAIWISIQALSLVEIARVLITNDSVKMVIYPKKQYFKGDFNYINQLLHADLDFSMLQAVLFGNSAEFYDDDERLRAIVDKDSCRYLLSTERKRKLRRITTGQQKAKESLQTMTLNPTSYKILKNEFADIETNRRFEAQYANFLPIDSVYAPRLVNIDIQAEKKVNLKIEYVRMEVNEPQKMPLNIPQKYDPISIEK